MADDTPLARARRSMTAAPDDDGARLAYYRAFADAELCLFLDREPEGQDLTPRLFPLEEGPVVLAFEGEERLAAFAEGPVPYAALPGRVIATALAGRATGIGVNLGDESAFLMPPDAVGWLADALARVPAVAPEVPVAWRPPARPGLAPALARRLAGLGAFAARGWLADVTYADGREGSLLVLEGVDPKAKAALAKAASEALLFMGESAGQLDLAFLSAARCAELGLSDIAAPVPLSRPQMPERATAIPAPPGSDPDRPPRLR